LNPEPAVIQLMMTTSKNIYEFVLRNILNQNKHTKVKDFLLLTNEGEKTEKKPEKNTENSQNTLSE